MEVHDGHSQLWSRATTESLTQTVFEYEEQIELLLHVIIDAQHYDVALTFMRGVGVDRANANISGPDKVQRLSDTLAGLVDNATDFLVGESAFIFERNSLLVPTTFIPTAFVSRFKRSDVRAGADAGRWHTAGCVGTWLVDSTDESGGIIVENDKEDNAADNSMEETD